MQQPKLLAKFQRLANATHNLSVTADLVEDLASFAGRDNRELLDRLPELVGHAFKSGDMKQEDLRILSDLTRIVTRLSDHYPNLSELHAMLMAECDKLDSKMGAIAEMVEHGVD